MRDADEESGDERHPHSAHVQASGERGQASRASKSLTQRGFGAGERLCGCGQRPRQRELGGALQQRQGGGGDIRARVAPLALGHPHGAGDQGGRHHGRQKEAQRKNECRRGRDDGDDRHGCDADDERDERG